MLGGWTNGNVTSGADALPVVCTQLVAGAPGAWTTAGTLSVGVSLYDANVVRTTYAIGAGTQDPTAAPTFGEGARPLARG